jgi:ABC-type multidrug transport system fused ATPase/permease subunit
MKKIGAILIFSLLILNLFFLASAFAQELGDSGLPPDLEKVQQVGEQVSNTDTSTAYLQQEWKKILEKSQVGKFLLPILTLLAPVLSFVTGVKFSLSWLFALAFIIWTGAVIVVFWFVKSMFQGKLIISIPIALIIPTIAAQVGTIKMLASSIEPLFTKPWLKWIAVAVAILLLWIYSAFMKKYGKALEEKKKKEDEERREQKQETLEKIADVKLKAASIP